MSTFSGRWILTINLVLYVFSMWYLCIIRWLDWPRQTCYTCLSQALFATKPAAKWNLHWGNAIGVWAAEDGRPVSVFYCFTLISFSFLYFVFFFFVSVFVLLNLFHFNLWAGFPALCKWYSIKVSWHCNANYVGVWLEEFSRNILKKFSCIKLEHSVGCPGWV